jgi:deoxyadenosine/deoxycytidine kinase
MINTLSGPDGSGKTTLAKLLHEKLNSTEFYLATNAKFTLIDTEWCAPNKFSPSFNGAKFLGFNLALAQMYESMDNFIRDRGALDE